MAASYPFPLTWVFAASGSKPYSLTRLGLAPLAPSVCLYGLTSLHLPAAIPCCGLDGTIIPGLIVISLSLLLSPLALVSLVVEDLSPPHLCLSSPGTTSPLGVTPEVLSP